MKVEVLDIDECLRLLGSAQIGRLGFVDDGAPVILPVNYLLDRGTVLVRTAEGSKLEAAVRGARVAFEVDDFDASKREGWSVLVKGRAAEVWEPSELDHDRDLPLRPWAAGEKEHFLVVHSSQISGRRITGGDPSDAWG
jgi:nitroimidazol reductase NimA-like FMN-containing flavoprotein (pyridoxamine 5'-phosphate oxidase superfamily)